MQGYMCRIVTLRGKSPAGKIGNQATKDIKDGSAWIDMRQALAIWLKLKVKEADVRVKKVGKSHDIVITI